MQMGVGYGQTANYLLEWDCLTGRGTCNCVMKTPLSAEIGPNSIYRDNFLNLGDLLLKKFFHPGSEDFLGLWAAIGLAMQAYFDGVVGVDTDQLDTGTVGLQAVLDNSNDLFDPLGQVFLRLRGIVYRIVRHNKAPLAKWTKAYYG